jgi:ferredoxin--NADP+ reductase
VLRFLRSPIEIQGDGRVERIVIGRNRLERDESGRLGAIDTGEREIIECGLVLRSVGYRAVPLPEVPFDERYFILPNERGRVLGADGEPLPGVYAVGWIKRGPTGILGTNKRDAQETVDCLAADLASGALPQPPNPDRDWIDSLLGDRKSELVTVDGWRAIEALELRRGRDEQRPRVKLASRDELLAAAKPSGRQARRETREIGE